MPITLLATDTIIIQKNQYFIDHTLNLVLSNLDTEAINLSSTESTSHILIDEVWQLETPLDQVAIGTDYQITNPNQDSTYTLYFTELPIIEISTDASIIDEADVPALFTLIESNGNSVQSHLGVQYRGGWTQTLPKKSLEMEFWTDPVETDTRDLSLLGMREDDDWNLQAMYNEPLRIRSKTNFDLWRQINILDYQDSEPNAINGVRLNYAEVFINDSYQGIYSVGEKLDRKQLKLKSHDGSIRGELYKGISWGAPTFGTLPNYDNNSEEWGGFEYRYPSQEIDWTNLYDFVDYVINEEDVIFFEEIHELIDMDNLVDYFIFLNLLRATDNTGKNIYIGKYDIGEKYFYIPWDLDGTWGTIWNGTNDTITNDLLLNGLFDRLMVEPCLEDGFREQLKTKWELLRNSQLSNTSLAAMFENNRDLLYRNGAYEREAMAWQDYEYSNKNKVYLENWMEERLNYLDLEFGAECTIVSTTDEENSIGVSLLPNPTYETLTIKLDHHSNFEIAIYNSIGVLMMTSESIENTQSVSIGHLHPGIYIVNISSNGETIQQTIVIQ